MIDTLDWRCFLSLESEFVDTLNTVEFHKDNFSTFSIRYRSLILQTCAEIEKFCKYICNIPQEEHSNMGIYREYINEFHKGFSNIQIIIPSHLLCVSPWLAFNENKSPHFWQAYQAIKHQGKLNEATFDIALQSLAAHFAIMVAWHVKSLGTDFSKNASFNEPKLFTVPELKHSSLVLSGSKLAIPGFTDNLLSGENDNTTHSLQHSR